MTSLAAQITAAGISAPDYPTILASLQDSYRGIYGSDVDLDPDTQDGQLLAIFARAIYDCNQSVISSYNAFSPNTAQGTGLSNLVKLNGLRRKIPTNSTAVLTLVGAVGTVITNGVVGDNVNLDTRWTLPATVTIPLSGTIDVTATCTAPGSTAAAIGSLTRILTPTFGWQSATNSAIATAGNPVEADPELRQRQTVSTALPALSNLQAIYSVIDNLDGVTRLAVYENDTDSADSNGISAHSISAVVLGGDVTAIANAIASKKAPGTGTYGSTSVVVVDSHGVSDTIHFYILALTNLDVHVTVKALAGFAATTEPLIQAAVAAFISGLDIGEDSYYLRLVAPANLEGDVAVATSGLSQADLDVLSKTFTVTAVTQGAHGGLLSAADVVIAFNAAATCGASQVSITVV